MPRACILDFICKWDEGLLLCEFAYNNSFYSSIEMTPYETLYDRCCGTFVGWEEAGIRSFFTNSLLLASLVRKLS